jgi:cyanobactin maturation PatA/PatG family protease
MMADFMKISGLHRLQERIRGDPRICVAVLDGPVDLGHPCFAGADLTVLPVLGGQRAAVGGPMSAHGTHVASVIFGRQKSPVEGLAPECRGVIIPVFSDHKSMVPQLDLTRGIELAVEAGAHLINISGGQLIEDAEAEVDEWLQRAVELCRERDVLIAAATGNDRCACLHLPAALPSVLAVGAMDDDGYPLEFSNWGAGYERQGILAPGFDVLGAVPGGGTTRLTGSSFATPIVTGVAALLLSVQLEEGGTPSPHEISEALLAGVRPCKLRTGQDPGRCLAGRLDITGALRQLRLLTKRNPMSREPKVEEVEAVSASCACQETFAGELPGGPEVELALASSSAPASVKQAAAPVGEMLPRTRAAAGAGRYPGVVSSGSSEGMGPSQDTGLVYALGTLGYDFGTEARRDTFKQLMPLARLGETLVPANPHDNRQMVDYLAANPSESKALIWTLNLELTPIYAVEPVGPFGHAVHDVLRGLLTGEIEAEHAEAYIERVSMPGLLSGRTARLFSGQIVPVIELGNVRGLYGWRTTALIKAAIAAIGAENVDEARVRRTLEGFLNRVYYDLRNLGATSRDRALNFAVTNAFQAATTFTRAIGEGMELDTITVERSPICRLDSDCWDVKLKFFDPENDRRAKRAFRFTIDVSDTIPVTLGEVRTWTEAN